ncbi:23S rRNA (pseudouridine(1915)-N(3))-methyltransferase RlmH [Acidithiobacillus sp. AC3]
MRLLVLALGTRMPNWVEAAVEEYRRRISAPVQLEWRSLPLAQRGRQNDPARWRREEGERLLASTRKDSEIVALEVTGRSLRSEELAQKMDTWINDHQDVTLWIGGPDGIDPALRPHWRWSLSALTLAHPVVRVVLAEQLYRAWSIRVGLPYHRGGEENGW